MPEPPPPARVLLVDDSSDNLLIVRAFLKKTPALIDYAENGAAGVDKFKTGRYDLVLMDVHMPVMDGYEASRLIREWERSRGLPATPIIALTADASEEGAERALESGYSEHLTKPIQKQVLLEVIGRHARKSP